MNARPWASLMFVLASGVVLLSACQSDHVPASGSEAYREVVSAFYTGVAAIQVGENFRAEERLTDVTELAPGEPAAWANLGVLALRQQEYATAAQHLERARALAPESSNVLYLSGLMEREQGRLAPAIEHLSSAVEQDTTHLHALFALAQAIEQYGETDGSTNALPIMNRLLRQRPGNLVVLIERARLAAKQGDTKLLRTTVDRLEDRAQDWPDDVIATLRSVQDAAQQDDLQTAATQIAFLANELQRLPAYQTDRAAVQPSPGQTGTLMTRFVRMDTPQPQPAPPDSGIAFTSEPPTLPEGDWAWVGQVALTNDAPPDLIVASGEAVWIRTGFEQSETLPFPGGANHTPPTPHGITRLDYDYDFRMDVALAGQGGVRLFRQTSQRTFEDVSDEAIPASVRNTPYVGAWTADLDMEGDLDLVLAPSDGAPVVLRNNGDNTFSTEPLLTDIDRLRQFVWADFDGDGDPDAATLDANGRLQIFSNQRHATPRFVAMAPPDTLGPILAHATGDLDADGTLDLAVLQADGSLQRLSHRPDGTWSVTSRAQWAAPPTEATSATARLFVKDFDNNGALDLLASSASDGSRLWLGDGTEQFDAHTLALDMHVLGAGDMRGAGRLDLLALTSNGAPVQLINEGTRNYASNTIRPQAAQVRGDRRINPFGLGGEIELRAGLLFQKQVIDDPIVHFGLGDNQEADLARIIWPNGTVQAEFDLLSTQTAQTQQRLKGSCPWVFTHDGDSLRFVTDFLWRTALGLRINAQGGAAVIHSEDRVKIDGDALASRDGFYDVRITADLWETHFFDHVALMTVDHPEGTEVFVDERFTVPPSKPPLRTVDALQPVAQARNHEGRDVTDRIRARDERYLDTFDLGPYQGLAEEHFVEVDLGDDVPADGPLWLVASGWVYPTDSSINLAIAQGDHPAPRSLQLEVPDGAGGWTVVDDDLGFPAGKTKTMLIDLADAFAPGTPRRVRLRTTMEIYWDRLAWTTGRPDAATETHTLDAETAELRYRGFSEVRQASRRAPELPIYSQIAASTPIWRDLVGYYTRFGDVRELTREIDDRYVIMNAGDELIFRFSKLPPPPEGWTRDFVLVGDGWVKDGDYNTGYSTTVRPLPYHGMTDYGEAPGRLEDDPVYKRHSEDWKTYHTRYITAQPFQHALVPQ